MYIVEFVECFWLKKHWVGTWGCAPYAVASANTPPSPYIANNTLRQIVRVSIGGDSVRVKFSNSTCATSVTMNKVNIAVQTGGSVIDASTITQLKFSDNASVTMSAGSTVTSDPVAFNLTPNMRVAITIYYGQAASTADMTGHVGSRTDSYILAGDQTASATFSGATVVAHWYTISAIDVLAPSTAGCVAVLGNSITDGYGLSGGLQNRWTDKFSELLLSSPGTQEVGVLNLGIGATNVSGTGATTGAARYQQDVLNQSGIKWAIIFYGINDIGGSVSASTITAAYQKMVTDAHAINIKVYGATITPVNGSSYFSTAHEAVRSTVNAWIKTPGNLDGYIDFDSTIRDPSDTTKLQAAYSNDWLHPNAAGYKLLGESIDPKLFIITGNPLYANAGTDQFINDTDNNGSETVTLNGSLSTDDGTITSYIWKEGGNQIATGVSPSVSLSIGTHTITLTVTDDSSATASDIVTITVLSSGSNIPLEAECGTVGSLFNITADANASNGTYITVQPGNNSTSSAPSSATGLVTIPFTVIQTGTYTMWVRVICQDADGDSFWIKMDDGSFVTWNNITNATMWTWIQNPTTFSLATTGSHTLTIGYREDGAKLDKIYLTIAGDTPSGTGPLAVNICTSNLTPFANAGSDQTVTDSDNGGSESVTLDGSGSTDPDGTISSYVWSESGSQIATGANPSVSLSVGIHTITLTVTDDDGAICTDKVVVTVKAILNNVDNVDNDVNGNNIYPNPVSRLLNLSLTCSSVISLYNGGGQQLLKMISEKTNVTIDMANYLPGIYFLKITNPDQTIVKKIIKK